MVSLQRMALKRELQRLEEVDGSVLYAFGLSKVIPAECKRNWVRLLHKCFCAQLPCFNSPVQWLCH